MDGWPSRRPHLSARKPPYEVTDPHYRVLTDLWEKGWLEGAILQARLHGRFADEYR